MILPPASEFTGGVATPLKQGFAMTTTKLVSKKELKSLFGIPYSFVHIARLEAADKFPKRIRLGQCRVAWLSEEVQNWIDERIASR